MAWRITPIVWVSQRDNLSLSYYDRLVGSRERVMKGSILKFGGTSVGSPESIAKVAEIVSSQRDTCLGVVVSACAGVTDVLDAIATADGGDRLAIVDSLERRHAFLIQSLLKVDKLPEVEVYFSQLSSVMESFAGRKASPMERAEVLSFGERISAVIVTKYFQSLGINSSFVDARNLLITDSNYLDATVNIELSTQNVIECFNRSSEIKVVTGFIGKAPNGETTVLGRGGSDYTATVLGAALSADEVQIWTDVSGVFSEDPRKNPAAMYFKELSFDDAHKLAVAGAKVIFPKCITAAKSKSIPIRVKNTFRPQDPGTLISRVQSTNNDAVSIVP